MGNTCEPEAQTDYIQNNLPGSRIKITKPINNMPKSSIAYQVVQPELHPNV